MPRTRFPFRVFYRGFSKPLTGVFAAAGLLTAAFVAAPQDAYAGNSLLMQHVAGDMKGSRKAGGMREMRPRKDGGSHGRQNGGSSGWDDGYGGRKTARNESGHYGSRGHGYEDGGYGGRDGQYRKGRRGGDGGLRNDNQVRNSNRNTNTNTNTNTNRNVNNNINTNRNVNRNVNKNRNVNTAVNRNNITVENNILLGERRSGVRYVGGGKHHSVRYGGGARRVSSTHTVSSRRMAKSKVGRYRLGGNTLVHGGRGGGGGFSNSGMIVVSINNHSNNSGMSEVAGSSVTQSNVSDCAYGTYCTINLGGPKIITYNDVADIEDGEFTGHEDVPDYDLRYAK